jgi:hypothetical protein
VTKLQSAGEESTFNSTFHIKVEAKLQQLSQKGKRNFKSAISTETLTNLQTQQKNE